MVDNNILKQVFVNLAISQTITIIKFLKLFLLLALSIKMRKVAYYIE